MQKDSQGYIGFVFKDGMIKSLVKDSSAARNGVLTEHQLIEVNGQNTVGVKVRSFRSLFLYKFVDFLTLYCLVTHFNPNKKNIFLTTVPQKTFFLYKYKNGPLEKQIKLKTFLIRFNFQRLRFRI